MPIRGIQEKHEHAAQQIARDTRPIGIRVSEFLSKPETIFVLSGTAISAIIFFPALSDVMAVVMGCLFWFLLTRQNTLPFRMPKSSGLKDFNDMIPGTAKPKKGGGISFFGNDRFSKEELWFTNDDLRTHVLIFGSTGSGKTEALVSIAYNSLVHGSGFIYVDGKGDNSLFAKVFSMVRSMGREDDILLINFMTGARDVIGPQENRLSNTMNPFALGSSSMLAQLVVSLMDSGSQGGSGDMWKGRAINFIESLMKILTAMRDAGHVLLDANLIRDYFLLEKLEEIVVDKRFPVENGPSVSLEDYPPQILEPLKNYVLNLPGYNPSKKGDQESEVREQHGFITMQLTRVFGSLADTYGHIIRTNLAEVDFKDVVLNRRILVVLLPALEKSPEELATLGKVIIASLKAMMAAGLGDAVEGDYRDVILRKPTTSPSPYVCIMDEYGYYAVPGFAVVPAQARSLGFSAIFAGQDLPAFEKASKEEAASIGANCNIKICMKLEDPQGTWEFFNKAAGETYVTNVSGFQMNNDSVSMNYMDTRNASVDRRQRIELLDLKDQREGEAHIFFKSKIIRGEMFYANPKPVRKMRINHFLKVDKPPEHELYALAERLSRFASIFSQKEVDMPSVHLSEDILILTQALSEIENMQPHERGIVALISILENEVVHQQNLSAPYESQEADFEMSAFTKVPMTQLIQQMIGSENVDLFSLPLIRRGSTFDDLKHIERLCGQSEEEAQSNAENLIEDIEEATSFPPNRMHFQPSQQKLLKDISDLIYALGGDKVDFANLPSERIDLSAQLHQYTREETAEQTESEEFETDFDLDEEGLPDLSALEPEAEAELPELPELDSQVPLPEAEQELDIDIEPENPAQAQHSVTDPELVDFPMSADLPEAPTLEELEEIFKDYTPVDSKEEDEEET